MATPRISAPTAFWWGDPVNYLGNKIGLTSEIFALAEALGLKQGELVADLFTGTAAVAWQAMGRGFDVYANDLSPAMATRAHTLLVHSANQHFNGEGEARKTHWSWGPSGELSHLTWGAKSLLRQRLETLNMIDPIGYVFNGANPRVERFVHEYANLAGRCYWTPSNGLKIAVIREKISGWQAEGTITADDADRLVGCLIEAADMRANTTSTYGAHLKPPKRDGEAVFKASATLPVHLWSPRIPVNQDQRSAWVTQLDAIDAVKQVLAAFGGDAGLAYIDPPYNGRRYDTYFHLPDTIAAWDLEHFTPQGKCGYRPRGKGPAWNSKRRVYAEAKALCMEVAKAAKSAIVSYSNEGFLSIEAWREALAEAYGIPWSEVLIREIDRSRFQCNTHEQKASGVTEYLIAARRP